MRDKKRILFITIIFCLFLTSTGIAEEMNSFLWVKAGETQERELLLKYGIPSSNEKSVLRYTENQHADFKGWKEVTFSSDASGIIRKITGERSIAQEDSSESTKLDNDLVRSAQEMLKILGCKVDPEDGVLGPKTRKAMLDVLKHCGFLKPKLSDTSPGALSNQELLFLFDRLIVRPNEMGTKSPTSSEYERYDDEEISEPVIYDQGSHVKYGDLAFYVSGAYLRRYKYLDYEGAPKNLEIELAIHNHGKRPESLYDFSFSVFDDRGAVYEPTSIKNELGLYSRLNPSSGTYPVFNFKNFPCRKKGIFFAICTNQGDTVAVFRLKPEIPLTFADY